MLNTTFNTAPVLKIGFTNKYFTLWSVTESTIVLPSEMGYTYSDKTDFCYIQNLSMDEDKAIEKAIKRGVKNTNVDHELRGQTTSFSRITKTYCEIPIDNLMFFTKGKYEDMLFKDCTDHNYMMWYHNNILDNNPYMIQALIDVKQLIKVEVKGVEKLMTSTQFERYRDSLEFIKEVTENDGKIDILFRSNLKVCQPFDEYALSNMVNELKQYDTYYSIDYNVKLLFKDSVMLQYDGHDYALPVNVKTGKGMRIKGKEFNLVLTKYDNQIDEQIIYLVESITSKK